MVDSVYKDFRYFINKGVNNIKGSASVLTALIIILAVIANRPMSDNATNTSSTNILSYSNETLNANAESGKTEISKIINTEETAEKTGEISLPSQNPPETVIILNTENISEKLTDKIDIKVRNEIKGREKIPVIIELQDSGFTKDIKKLNARIKENQDKVLSTLSSSEFNVKYKYNTVNAFAGEVTKAGLDKLEKNPFVKKIYFDGELKLLLDVSVPLINATEVWKLQKNGVNITGRGQTVCIVDSGIDYNHPDLGGCFGTGCRVLGGYDFYNFDSNPMDDNSHGTHVAGIVGANGIVKGVAPDANFAALKVCSAGGSCNGSAMIAGMDWCNNNSALYNISVITMSIGDGGEYDRSSCPTWIDSAINAAYGLGIFVSIASGNEYHSNGISYPGCSPNATSVGATDDFDVIAGFTNTGPILDVLAPGVNIYSTIIGNSYGTKSGTSMATPHVAGAATLLRQYDNNLMPDEIKSLLKNNPGKYVTDPDNGLVFPRINILKTILATSAPKINKIECEKNGTFANCSSIGYNDILTKVRANCTDFNGSLSSITEAGFKLKNLNDDKVFFNLTTNTTEDGFLTADNDDITIEDSGNFELEVKCKNNESIEATSSEIWLVPFGMLQPYLINPTAPKNVKQNSFFDFSSGVRCVGGECGNVSATLDPYGPDGYNYTAYNSSEPGGDSFIWEEIITNGEGIPLWNGSTADDSYLTAPINFTFVFYGVNYSTAYVSSNGRIHFTSDYAGIISIGLPSDIYKVVAPFNKDMYVRAWTKVFYKIYDNPKRFVVEYKDLDYFSPSGSNFTFEVILYEDGRIKIQYNASSASYAPGIQIGINYGSTGNKYLLIENDAPDMHKGEAVTFYPPSFEKKAKGIVPMSNGTPFYTIDLNPAVCENMNDGDVCNSTWRVNAKGEADKSYEFFTIYNGMNYPLTQNITDKVNITIINTTFIINKPECEKNGTFADCSSILYDDTLSRVRVNCTDETSNITEARFRLKNLDDNNTFFDNTTTAKAGDFWILDNEDITIKDSGDFKLEVTCKNNELNEVTYSEMWLVPFGRLESYLINPTTLKSVKQNAFFDFSSGVRCVGGECGNVNATLDPTINLYDAKGYRYDIADGCYIIDGNSDTFDDGLTLYVNGVYYNGIRNTTEDNGREAVCDSQNISNLIVSRKVFVDNATEDWARYIEIYFGSTPNFFLHPGQDTKNMSLDLSIIFFSWLELIGRADLYSPGLLRTSVRTDVLEAPNEQRGVACCGC